MLDRFRTQSVTEETLRMVRLLKQRSVDDTVWEQAEKVLLMDIHNSGQIGHDLASADRNGSGFLGSDSLVRYDDDRLRNALIFIHQHLDSSIGVQDIAREICVSRRWLEYAFRAAFGLTPFQYLRSVRLELARLRLLSEPQSKVHQIALGSGYTSARQFTMTFRQYFGYSPSVCRNELADCESIGMASANLRKCDPLAEAC